MCNIKRIKENKIWYKESDTKAKFSISLGNTFRGL